MTDLHFWLFLLVGGSAVAAAVGMLLLRNAVYSALCLIYIMAALALLFLMLDAPFLALVQVTVYAGAVMVLFLFVMMLLGNQVISAGEREFRGLPVLASLGATAFILIAGLAIQSGDVDETAAPLPAPLLRVAQFLPITDTTNLHIDGERHSIALPFGAASNFQELAVGAHSLSLKTTAGQILHEAEIELAEGTANSLLIYESAAGNASALVPESKTPLSQRESRLRLVNLSGTAVTVYDTGSDRVLDSERDPEWAVELASGEQTQTRLSEPAPRDLAFIDPTSGQTLLRTPELKLSGGESATLVLVSEGQGRFVLHHLRAEPPDSFGSPAAIGQSLFRRYLLPFEMVGVLLLAALVGGIIIAQGGSRVVRRRDVRRPVARTLAAAIDAQVGADQLPPAAVGETAEANEA